MARLESQAKMGYYPTPESTLQHIKNKLNIPSDAYLLDPCCGEGNALQDFPNTYGVELDTLRASKANLNNVLCGSIYESIIRPLESFSMLYLNPPYDWEKGERMEFLFLKQSHKWLTNGGLLVFIIPEYILERKKIARWISRRYSNIHVCKVTREDFPRFKQVVLFAAKGEESPFPLPPYSHIEDTTSVFNVPPSTPPQVFEQQTISPESINAYKDNAKKNITESLYGVQKKETEILSPLFPLRKGHLVSLLMSGVMNGELNGSLVFKCFTERAHSTRTEESKEITTDTYSSGIRVIEKGAWYDVK